MCGGSKQATGNAKKFPAGIEPRPSLAAVSPLVEMLGGTLLTNTGTVSSTLDALAGKQAIGLFFSVHGNPQCDDFLPKLANWYSSSLQAKGFEVIFMNADGPKTDGMETPWLALPPGSGKQRELCEARFAISSSPALVVLDTRGRVLTTDGVTAISSDHAGNQFPWKDPKPREILDGAKILGQAGQELDCNALHGRVFAILFSRRCDRTAKGFTTKLAGWYSKSLKDKGLEVLFISSDKDEATFVTFFGEQPWLALDFADERRKDQLSHLLGSGIPKLVIVDKDDTIITKDGRTVLNGDPDGLEFPWYTTVHNFLNGPGDVQFVPTVVVFCETSDDETKQAVEKVMSGCARLYIMQQRANGDDDPKYKFSIATMCQGVEGVVPRLRRMLSLPTLTPAKHEHPLQSHVSFQEAVCDGCQTKLTPETGRFKCTEGCNFDFCSKCNETAVVVVPRPPKLMILNFASQGTFYEGPEGDITTEVIEKTLADCTADRLKKRYI